MKAQFDATGSVIAITGAANGIGRALALACAKAGAKVIALDVDDREGEALQSEHAHIEYRHLDVADRAAVSRVFADVLMRHGQIDGLVLGAAIQPRIPVQDTPADTWQHVLDVNLNGVVWCYQAVLPSMIARRAGSVIAFSSGLASSGWLGASAYATTKAALTAFVKSAAKEVAAHRVRFNLIAPGVIDTPQYRRANEGNDGAHWQQTLGVGAADDVVGPLMFLLSDAASMTASLVSRDFAYASRDDA
ncbi:SDR family NAD(P)-dependent oxidoreductase [Paraburkholderia sp.]|uniref:SDR family NAD(P)-dependent oxidoreductase n=1 Tax=Paraburkholderia sp. TaxID=1926495 RepID=UPI003D6EFFE6